MIVHELKGPQTTIRLARISVRFLIVNIILKTRLLSRLAILLSKRIQLHVVKSSLVIKTTTDFFLKIFSSWSNAKYILGERIFVEFFYVLLFLDLTDN